ncbi:unnamed protein product [Symbiodinium natans]|uniref:Uncharacterized protein n=1 Tax=Symbiodinium natans TaxID=878477 RepID=A0A812RRT7_9DINO|nr:unnamed protein product [Symbiodinium natans]
MIDMYAAVDAAAIQPAESALLTALPCRDAHTEDTNAPGSLVPVHPAGAVLSSFQHAAPSARPAARLQDRLLALLPLRPRRPGTAPPSPKPCPSPTPSLQVFDEVEELALYIVDVVVVPNMTLIGSRSPVDGGEWPARQIPISLFDPMCNFGLRKRFL